MEELTLEEIRKIRYIIGTSAAFAENEMKPIRGKIQVLYENAKAKSKEMIIRRAENPA